MSPKGAARRAPVPSSAVPSPPSAALQQAAAALRTVTDASSLAKCVALVAAAQPHVLGARVWRLDQGKASVWHEAGMLPESSALLFDRLSPEAARGLGLRDQPDGHAGATDLLPATRAFSEANGTWWVCSLGEQKNEVGLLEVIGTEPLSDASRGLLEVFAHISRIALTRADQQQAVEELSAIVEATKQLNSTLDLGELINIILRIAVHLAGADRGTVFLLDRPRNEIWSLVGLGLEQREIRIPMDRGIAGWVATHAETVNIPDAYADRRFEPEVDRTTGYRTRNILCLPIRNKDQEVIGVLQLLNKAGGPFLGSDERAILHLSDHVALALENATLHRELLAKQKLERDLALARVVQRGLLPEEPPRLAGFDIGVTHETSLMVGGDYYDFIPIGAGRMLIVVADVEGKGVASALVMANLQATLHALAGHVESLEEMVSSVNRILLSTTRVRKLISMFIGMLDHQTHTLRYVNAGHVPPVVVRAAGGSLTLSEGGMLIGVFPDSQYKAATVKLEPGDVIAAYTDGITESMDIHSRQYGAEGLIAAIRQKSGTPAEEMVQHIMQDVLRFSLGGHHEDDRVILVLKVH